MVRVIGNKIIFYALKDGGLCPSTILRFHRETEGDADALEGINNPISCVHVR
jgi:hypothetical protein